MPVELDQAFISYTSDLQEECDAAIDVCRRLRVFAFAYVDQGATKERPIEVILRELLNSDVYLGILGGRLGHEYPPPEGRSIVEFEHDSFRELRKNGSYQVGIYPKVLPDDSIEPKQRVLRARMSDFVDGRYVGKFVSIPELREQISITLGNWKGDRQNTRNKKEEPDKARIHRNARLIATTIAASAVLVTAVWAIFTLGLSSNPVAIMLICVAWSILLCWVVTRIY
jgi:hypothetical protein